MLDSSDSTTLLPHKLAVDLLRTDVIIDEYGRPTANWKNYPLASLRDSYSEGGSRSSDATSEGKKASSQILNDSLSRNVRHRVTGKTQGFMTTNVSSRNLDSMDDFANWRPIKSVHMVPVPPANSKQLIKPKRKPVLPLALDSTPPWMTIPQTEKTIHDKKTLVFGKKQQKKRRAVEILNDLKEDFSKLQARMDRHVQEECRKDRLNQFKTLRHKFNAIVVGPPTYEALHQMREATKMKVRNRRDTTMQPMKWFSDLKAEIALEVGNEDCREVDLLFSKIARFQYEDDHSIPFAKEKLCLLVMSIPAYLILTGPMTYGLMCVVKMLGLPQEILQYWLSGRKLDEISNMQKRICC